MFIMDAVVLLNDSVTYGLERHSDNEEKVTDGCL
jgi:hypothetical protein